MELEGEIAGREELVFLVPDLKSKGCIPAEQRISQVGSCRRVDRTAAGHKTARVGRQGPGSQVKVDQNRVVVRDAELVRRVENGLQVQPF